ncbi:MAG TPA: PhzF family phenazine biosynthesis protein [Marmoricola sp.]|nr:PhzF family phenazine biosynthesis protein [Marmoricola sp.]
MAGHDLDSDPGRAPDRAPGADLGQDLEYDVVDVFADHPFAGNQLAVVHGAAALSDGQLLEIAREFNFSETTFPVSTGSTTGSDFDGLTTGNRYRVRIFTPGGEIPFAGHPTLGTAWVLRERGLLDAEEVVQVCAAGEITVRFDESRVELGAVPRDLAGPLPDRLTHALLGDLGLAPRDLAGEAWLAGTGLTFVHLPVSDDAVTRAHPSMRSLQEYAADLAGCADPVDAINLHSITGPAGTGRPLAVHSRVFVPGLDVAEDPATGSAAAGLGMALVATGVLPAGGDYLVRQGLEMGRPSRLHGRVEASAGRATRCFVAGQVHPVARGRIRKPEARTP